MSNLIVGILATFLVTFYVVGDGEQQFDGLFGLLGLIRKLGKPNGGYIRSQLSLLLFCPYCFSIWSAVIVGLIRGDGFVDMLAYAGGSCVIFLAFQKWGVSIDVLAMGKS